MLIGKQITSRDYWDTVAHQYAENLSGGYHRHRLDAIKKLFPDLKNKTVIDFGCGDGALLKVVNDLGASHSIGIDINPHLLSLAQQTNSTCLLGGVERLKEFGDCYCIIATNVLAYLSDEEESIFYREASRIARSLVVTHSNSLFDLFTLNKYTVDFFKRNFDTDPSTLLSCPNQPDRHVFNIRENPLSYPDKLERYGFKVERMEFMNFHPKPPLLSSDDPDDMDRKRPDPPTDWKRFFQCSMFGVLATRQ